MPPKVKPEDNMKMFEDAKRREFILSLAALGTSYGEICNKVLEVFGKKPARSTVQFIIKRFKGREDMYHRGGPGRRTKMSPQYATFG